MKKILATTAALILVFACTDVPTQPVEDMDLMTSSAVIEGVYPGRYEIREAVINASPDFYDFWNPGLCAAWYAESHDWNSVISNFPDYEGTIKVTENKNFVIASCKFTDGSGAYEMNAEVGYTENCTIITEDGRSFGGGTGTVTAAANHEEEPGGNVTLQCKVALEDPPV
jgi:hypothetical protein